VTKLTLISPDVPSELMVKCGDVIAEPLTTADQLDLARALVQASKYGKDCAARQQALIDAVKTREEVMKSVKTQLEK
jgi:hypothetical protein